MLTEELGLLNQQIAAAGRNKVNNALLDRRDALIDQVTVSAGMSVSLAESGAANLKSVHLEMGLSSLTKILSGLWFDPSETYSYVVGPGVDNIYTSQVGRQLSWIC